ncbi:MAG: phytoene desaturase family protein [Planctomycetota bacterium]
MIMPDPDRKTNTNHIAVVGAGLGGLAAACTLAARGHWVTLFDKNSWLGGKAAQLVSDGEPGERFKFDMGPTILTVPKVLERIFKEAGRDMHDYLDLVRLDPQWRCFFDESQAGGGVLDLMQSVEDMKGELSRFAERSPASGKAGSPVSGEQYEELIKYTERLHRISDDFYFWKSIGGLKDMMQIGGAFNLSTLKDVLAMRMGKSVASTFRKYIPDHRVSQMLDHFTQYVGSSPYGSPSILCGIASMQVNEGVWYPMGGTRAVPEALTKLARELGVDLRPGEGVSRIVTERGKVVGVETDAGENVACGAVVSNMDAVRTHRELIGGDVSRVFDKRRKYEPACSGVVLYLGLDKAYDHVAHHNFVFSRDPEEEFDSIYHKGEPAPDPTAYLAATARTEPPGAVAPAGGEALYVLVHTPYLRQHHDWSKSGGLFQSYRQTILDKLKTTAGMPDIEDRIVFEKALTPQDIHERYNVLNGAIYGLASHGKWLGAFKPGNRSMDVEGLYLAGGAAHPGPGMPMVMMSGWIAADTLDQDGVVAAGDKPSASPEPAAV